MDGFEIVTKLLAVWKKFPFSEDREAFTDALRNWCDGKVERANWLLSQRDQFNEYPGPEVLRHMISEHFEPTGPNAPYQRMTPVHDGRTCKRCGGWGCIELNGKWAYCTCEDARDLALKVPGWIDFCNSFRGKSSASLLSARKQGYIPVQSVREPGDESEMAS